MLISTTLTTLEAQTILRGFVCREQTQKAAASAPETSQPETVPDQLVVQQALLLLANQSDYQMLGVCADNAIVGYQALDRYLNALGYPVDYERFQSDGPVYIKFNSKTGRCYLEPYAGDHRGVLVSCQSSDLAGINETFGHLPLDLFHA